MHARGTPASGKSTLARLLFRHIQLTALDIPVYLFSWPATAPAAMPSYYMVLNYLTGRPLYNNDWWERKVVLIIDEAQNSYDYPSLWNDLLKPFSSGETDGPMVILFSSYGSPSETPTWGPPGSTPIMFTTQQRISILPLLENNSQISIYFTRSEFDDVVSRVCTYYSKDGQPFLPTTELQEYVWRYTNGHPGAVRAVLQTLIDADCVRDFRKNQTPVTIESAISYLNNDQELFQCLTTGSHGFKRSLPRREVLQNNPELSQFLRIILAAGRSDQELASDPNLNECYKRGWLQAEVSNEQKTTYIFPTLIHKRYAESLLGDMAPPFPSSAFQCLKSLCFAVLGHFSAVALRSAVRYLSAGAQYRSVEAVYEDEFYRASYKLLGNVYLSSEWVGESAGGRVNFQIKSEGWAIECVRHGDRLEEHVARFLEGGKYYPWITSGEVQDFILLDFRKSKPAKTRDVSWLYYVVYSEDFTTYELYDAGIKRVGDQLALLG